MFTKAQATQLADIRQRSKDIWRVHDLPAFDPETGLPKPLVLTSQSDEDVKFLLSLLLEAQDEVVHLEELTEEPLSELTGNGHDKL